jgi:predicted acylesterase/phospholipase RssA
MRARTSQARATLVVTACRGRGRRDMSTQPEAPVDRFCDLVMKGGITSGVVYPKAIGLLAGHYRFRSIGGTSAGAIAAAVTAAAEYNRRENDSMEGFRMLESLPDALHANVPGTQQRKLLSLFQPEPRMRRLFSVLIASLNRNTTNQRILNILRKLLVAYWPATLASLAIAVAVAWLGQGMLAAVLLFVVALVASIATWVYVDVTRGLVANGFGMCTGMTPAGAPEALTPWLHGLVQRAAGLARDDPPLTFGQLWRAKHYPPPWLTLPADAPAPRSIDLQMFSTNLAHGRPYIFPLPEKEPAPSRFRTRDRLFFDPDELDRYLPSDVMAWLREKGQPYRRDPERGDRDPDERDGARLLEIPEPKDFPVLLAARMSLSFPLLFSAVPLYAIDYDAVAGQRRFRRCWFSDGGISSNFPMHLFDGLVPTWPTFGINLEARIEGRDRVYLPSKYEHGYGERWNAFADEDNPAARLGGFVSAIVEAMQNWNDNSLARMPGVRDRVARVRLDDDEGGLNLDMTRQRIEAVAAKGHEAAEKLLARFGASAGGAIARGWDEHRLVRLNVLLNMIRARAPGVAAALSAASAHVTDFETLLRNAMRATDDAGRPVAPPGFEAPITEQEAGSLAAAIDALAALGAALSAPSTANSFKPIPSPELRVRPPL